MGPPSLCPPYPRGCRADRPSEQHTGDAGLTQTNPNLAGAIELRPPHPSSKPNLCSNRRRHRSSRNEPLASTASSARPLGAPSWARGPPRGAPRQSVSSGSFTPILRGGQRPGGDQAAPKKGIFRFLGRSRSSPDAPPVSTAIPAANGQQMPSVSRGLGRAPRKRTSTRFEFYRGPGGAARVLAECDPRLLFHSPTSRKRTITPTATPTLSPIERPPSIADGRRHQCERGVILTDLCGPVFRRVIPKASPWQPGPQLYTIRSKTLNLGRAVEPRPAAPSGYQSSAASDPRPCKKALPPPRLKPIRRAPLPQAAVRLFPILPWRIESRGARQDLVVPAVKKKRALQFGVCYRRPFA